jgi:flagellar hook-associated protein 2
MTTNSIADTLSSSLGLSYGIDVSSLVTSLVAATKTPQESQITSQQTTNNARISALASAKSSLTTFSTALTELLKSSDYSGQPASSNTNIVSVSLPTNATGSPAGLPAQIEVKSLAAAQVVQSPVIAGGTATSTVGGGTLTLTTGSGANAQSFDITMSSANTLTDLATQINGKNAGVTASVVTDSSGARLVLKGQTGKDSTFTLSASAAASDDLKRFTFDGDTTNTANGMTRSQAAADAQVSIDNVAMSFSSNTLTTAIPNLRIDLNSASPGTTVTLATDQPTKTMSELVQDFVSTYNTMKSALNASTAITVGSTGSTTSGTLAGDSGVRDMVNRLAQLSSTQLSATGPYHTLADIGVKTNRDGTLAVDTDRLAKVLSDNPEAVTQMLNPTTPSDANPGIAGALSNITTYLTADYGPLSTSSNTYSKLADQLQKQSDDLDTKMTAYEDQLTTTYTAMQTQLTQLKAQQTYLTQQIASWNSKSS